MKDVHEYTIGQIARHVGKDANTGYVINWFGYTAANDTKKPIQNIQLHFLPKYWGKEIKPNSGRHNYTVRVTRHRRDKWHKPRLRQQSDTKIKSKDFYQSPNNIALTCRRTRATKSPTITAPTCRIANSKVVIGTELRQNSSTVKSLCYNSTNIIILRTPHGLSATAVLGHVFQ